MRTVDVLEVNVLGLKKSTPTCLWHINYWSRIVTNPKIHKLTSVMYKTIYELHTRHMFRSPWLVNVENILNQCGMPMMCGSVNARISTHSA